MKSLKKKLTPHLFSLSLLGIALMSGPVLQSYYPIERAKQDLIRRVRQTGRRTARKIETLTR